MKVYTPTCFISKTIGLKNGSDYTPLPTTYHITPILKKNDYVTGLSEVI